MTPQALPGGSGARKQTSRRAAAPHATALFWALWLLLFIAFVAWMQLR